jgi:7-carboxy-7-deazaguanine synthase
MFDIVEKFYTISGEAPHAGRPMYLVRFARCNLDCSYCDTKYRDEVAASLTVEELSGDVRMAFDAYPAAFILFTGGEPLLGERREGLSLVASRLPGVECYVETNGSIPIADVDNPWLRYVVDWKAPSSGFGDSFHLGNLPLLRPGLDCLKIVVASEDLDEIPRMMREIRKANPTVDVYLSPQWGRIGLDELAAFIIDGRIDARLSLQLHKVIWGDKRGV